MIREEIISHHFFRCTACKARARQERVHAQATAAVDLQPYATFRVERARREEDEKDMPGLIPSPFRWFVVRCRSVR